MHAVYHCWIAFQVTAKQLPQLQVSKLTNVMLLQLVYQSMVQAVTICWSSPTHFEVHCVYIC